MVNCQWLMRVGRVRGICFVPFANFANFAVEKLGVGSGKTGANLILG